MINLRLVIKNSGYVKVTAWALRSNHPWQNLLAWRKNLLFASVITETLVSYDRLLNTYELAQKVASQSLEGAFVECGVWRGGVAALMSLVAQEEGKGRRTHLFDSFEGCPRPTLEDREAVLLYPSHRQGEELESVGLYVASLEEVSKFLFQKLKLSPDLVKLHPGWFQHTLPRVRKQVGPISLLRIDADWYDSVKTCLTELYDQVVPGGYLILDDYGGYSGCRQAVNEFLAQRSLPVFLHRVDEYGAWFQKP